ncbi:hypothetical protein FIS3754_11990 [Fischerella sp. NIES-3754]|nr:hypothetical protein FIS3754_11990 [Fischerella sp. NIES-3754]BCX07566.1 MAG: hypothetical protein KatS3mg066_1425 [Fischerella sp.]
MPFWIGNVYLGIDSVNLSVAIIFQIGITFYTIQIVKITEIRILTSEF